jgi:acyl-CoA thioesterase
MYSMADTGMGAALYSLLEENESCATIEVKISYFKPVSNGVLICNTKVINKGRSISALESEILNNEKLIAKASGTFSIFSVK